MRQSMDGCRRWGGMHSGAVSECGMIEKPLRRNVVGLVVGWLVGSSSKTPAASAEKEPRSRAAEGKGREG